MPELNEDAKREIAEAVKIVREDRILKFMRESGKTPPAPTGTDPKNPTSPPANPAVPGTDPNDVPKKRRGVLWADLSED